MLGEGHIGVSIFFVLSGLLISLRYTNQVILSRHWLKHYFWNRFARIYPLYALLTAGNFLLIRYNPSLTRSWQQQNTADFWPLLLLNLTFLRGFFDQLKFTGIAQGWTLTVEECFYAFAPLLLVALTKRSAPYKLLLISAVGLLLSGYVLVWFAPHPFGFFGSARFMLTYTFFGRATEFMLGVALAAFIRQHYQPRLGSWATSIGVVWMIGSMYTLTTIPSQHASAWTDALRIMVTNLWQPLGIVLFFFGIITEQSWLRRVLASSLAQLLGKSSYAFYLIHLGAVEMAIRFNVSDYIYTFFFLALGVALLLWKYVEEPLNHWLRAIVSRQQALPEHNG